MRSPLCLSYVIFQDRDISVKKGSLDAMPFPPGVGGGRVSGDANLNTFEVITADRAIDENNVGNRMLRNMGWHEGSVIFTLFLKLICRMPLRGLIIFLPSGLFFLSCMLVLETNSYIVHFHRAFSFCLACWCW